MTHYLKTLAACGLALAMTACQDRQFTVEGTIEGAQDTMLYFYNVGITELKAMDSVKLGADGRFAFSENASDAPEFYMLRIGDQVINLSIDSTETVTIKAQMPGMAANYTVEGSENCEQMRLLTLRQQDLTRRVLAVERDMSLSQEAARDSLLRMIDRYKREVANDFIFQAPQRPFAYFALFQRLGPWTIFDPHADGLDEQVFCAVASCWDTFHPEALRTKNLHNIALENRQNQRIINAKRSQQLDGTQIVESGIIEIDLTDNHGHQQLLSALRGQVVLLDFHSFALPDSPQRILMLRELYNKYHSQGLEIFQVSVDDDEHFWKQKTHELPWISVLDTNGSAMRYNVQTVPEFFLIDRESQLQKRSSQIDNLEKEIERLLSFRR